MRRVRLTEGQLHNVIRESVSQILNELNWKTYDSAGRKMLYRNDQKKKIIDGYLLLRAGDKELNKQYPHLHSIFDKRHFNEPLTPEEQEELDTYEKDWDNHMDRKYKYEKGGRGYYLDDED